MLLEQALEQALAANNAVLQALTKILAEKGFETSPPATKPAKETAAKTEAVAKTEPAAAEKAAADKPAGLTYEAVAKVVIDYIKKNGRPAAEKILEPFGSKLLTDFKDKPDQFEGIVAAYKAAR